MPFAENLARLDEIAKRLESEPMSMDEALAVFEEGVALVKKSEKLLQNHNGDSICQWQAAYR